MKDIIENTETDKDTTSIEELNTLFSKKYNLLAETAVTLEKTYINHLSISKSLNIAVKLLDNSIEVYKADNNSLSRVCRLSGHEKSLTEIVFSHKDDHLLYSAGHDGIKLWDTRTSRTCVQEYNNEEDSPVRPYECMDVSCSDRVICAGSQLVLDDAYLVFWDQRSPEPLGGYWNSHTEDITQVKFHKEKAAIMASGSRDGLLNVYDLTESTEDDALTYTLNVENSVDKITWLSDKLASCITETFDLQIWDTTTGDKFKEYDREKIARSFKRSRADDCYMVDTYPTADGRIVVLGGSYAGKGDVLRSTRVGDKRLQPHSNFIGNKQIVRCCAYDKHRDVLVTTGESGLINLWRAEDSHENDENVCRKTNSTLHMSAHDQRHKPY